jgi:hypothetical protein
MPAVSSANVVDLVTGGISFLLTLMVLSYLIGDNPIFRIAIYLFIGVSAGYVASVAWHQVLYPRLVLPLTSAGLGERLLLVIPLVLGLLLLLKISPRTAGFGSLPMAFLVGIGAAVAIGGAVLGTIFPQTQASMKVFDLSSAGQYKLERIFEGLFMLVGTITALVYFNFGAKATATGPRRGKLISFLSWVGQIFIAITFGVLFAGVFMAALTALIERLNFIVTFLFSL